MTQTYFPFDSGAGANVMESQWSAMARYFLDTGVLKNQMNELQVYADSTGMQAKVKTGLAWMMGHFFQSDAEEIVAISSADPTNPRIDRVIVRVDWVANTIALAVLQGTPAVSPTPPALTQTSSRWEISLGQVNVPAGATTIAAGNITDERTYSGETIHSIGSVSKFVQTGSFALSCTSAAYTSSGNVNLPTSFPVACDFVLYAIRNVPGYRILIQTTALNRSYFTCQAYNWDATVTAQVDWAAFGH